MLLPGETCEELTAAGLKIIQPAAGYRYSLDPFLLCDFVKIPSQAQIADLGTGSGIIPLLLSVRAKDAQIVGVELQSPVADRARRSVELNALSGRLRVMQGDVREIKALLPPQSFDVVLANPPFREVGRGRVAPVAERKEARHELAGGMDDFIRAGFFLLKDGGRFCMVFLAERLAELLAAMRRERLEPKRLRCVHAREGEGARLVLVEGRKRGGPGLAIEPPLYIHAGADYTAEMQRIYRGG
ncbi:MAG: tRNA1(Val) (adenine(37)-N6)-methyltransferase [Desulfuromonadales bacterium]